MKIKLIKIFLSLCLLLVTGLGACLYFHQVLSSDVLALRKNYPVWSKVDHEYILVQKKPAHWVSVEKIAHKAKWAVIVSEDWAFYDHSGIDENQLKLAIEESIEAKELVRGASTITQQVVKNALLTRKKTLTRKFREVFYAFYIEHYFSKDEILEKYLNLVELGRDLYGIGPAAEFYFKKKPSQLTAKEGAFLAMLLPSPRKYSQSYRSRELTKFASEQVSNILVKLRQAKIITEDERLIFESEDLSFEAVDGFDDDLLSVENESYE